MISFELFLIILAGVAPIVALLFVLPKIKKKKKQIETKPYTPEKKEEPVVQPQKVEPKNEKPFTSIESEIESYRDYLQKRKLKTIKPVKLDVPEEFTRTEEYASFRRRKRMENSSNQDLNSLSPEIKALLIAGILDRKF